MRQHHHPKPNEIFTKNILNGKVLTRHAKEIQDRTNKKTAEKHKPKYKDTYAHIFEKSEKRNVHHTHVCDGRTGKQKCVKFLGCFNLSECDDSVECLGDMF